jgi:hypothetical protein
VRRDRPRAIGPAPAVRGRVAASPARSGSASRQRLSCVSPSTVVHLSRRRAARGPCADLAPDSRGRTFARPRWVARCPGLVAALTECRAP